MGHDLDISAHQHQFPDLAESDSSAQAFAIAIEWLAQPGVIALQPGPLHAQIPGRLVNDYNAVGPLMADAAIAALAMENGAVLASTDQDFRRFSDLRWVNPLLG